MIKILRYLKDYKKECILGPLFKLLEATFELFIPIIMAQIIDTGIARGDTGYIVRRCLLMALMGIIGLVCALTAQFFAAKAAVGYSTKLRKNLFEHIQRLAYTELDNVGVSALITRMTSDINQIQTGVNLVIRLFLRSPFIVFGAMIMAFRINVKASMVFLITIPALAIVVYGIMLISIPLYKKVQSGLDKVLLSVRENLSGVRVIRAINYEDDEVEIFNETNDALNKIQLKVGRWSAIMNPITYAIINISIVVIIRQGAIQVNKGIITTGEVIALVNYMSQILVELVKLANLIVTVNKSVACGDRVAEVFEIKPSMEKNLDISKICDSASYNNRIDSTDANYMIDKECTIDNECKLDNERKLNKESKIEKNKIQEINRIDEDILYNVENIEFCNVGLMYDKSNEESLSNMSFEIKQGETIGIIGGTGSGKTSLINLIPRYYDATSGEVRINGKNIKEYALDSIRRKICVVPQKTVLFKGTIRENMKIACEGATDEAIINALKIAKAYDFVSKKKGVLDYEIEQEGKNLSGGQKQRLAIARALLADSSVMIFDDSMSALDYATDASLRKDLSKITDRIKIIVSQRIASLGLADRIIVLDDGEIVGIGTHDELVASNEVYQEIYYSQVKND